MTTATLSLRPDLAWPVKFSAQEARTVVNRRLKKRADLKSTLYHHPFLGLVFQSGERRASGFPSIGRRQKPELIQAHVLVDLVGGRAYLADAWDHREFVAINPKDQTTGLRDPEPLLDEPTALGAARAVLAGVVLRQRKFAALPDLELAET